MDRMGPLLCLLSAAGFGAMAIFGKLAYDAGVEVGDLLLVRFALAAALLLAVAAATGALNSLSRRSVLAGLGMGAIGYATQSGLFFGALERMDASLLALILYVYPALVLIGAVALGRERASVRRVTALLIALAGTALVLVGAASGSLDALGAAMGFGAALAYTVYILTGDRVGTEVPPVALAAFVCLGATCTYALASVVRGGPELGFGADGWAWVGAIALVSTVAAILCFFAGLARVGPSAASILSTLEPVVTVALAAAAFGESLGAVQLVGGALVLGAVLVMQWPATAGRTWPSTADHAPASAITSPCLNSPARPSPPFVRTAEIHCLDEDFR
jgi:drug/metabolite transporter (DMT)-like permease